MIDLIEILCFFENSFSFFRSIVHGISIVGLNPMVYTAFLPITPLLDIFGSFFFIDALHPNVDIKETKSFFNVSFAVEN